MSLKESWSLYLPLLLAAPTAMVMTTLTACPDPHVPDPPTGPSCAEVCAHWAELGCEEAEPTPDGASCTEVCRSIQTSSLPDDLECQLEITACEQIDDC